MNLARAIGFALPPTIAWLIFRKKMSRRWSFRVGFFAIIMWLRPVNGLIVALLAYFLGITDETAYWILQLVYILPVVVIYFVIYFSKLPPKQEKIENSSQVKDEQGSVQIDGAPTKKESRLEIKTNEDSHSVETTVTTKKTTLETESVKSTECGPDDESGAYQTSTPISYRPKYCDKCGKKLEPNDKYCCYCGNYVE